VDHQITVGQHLGATAGARDSIRKWYIERGLYTVPWLS
jgi:hypothetical protein